MRAIILGLATATLATPAMAVDQFDLVCTGKYHERVNAKWKPVKGRYRIDLAAQAWCGGACSQISKIKAVEPGKLVLSRTDRSDGVSPYSYLEVDRTSGHYRSYMSGGLSFWEEEGQCEIAPFSGFPAAKF